MMKLLTPLFMCLIVGLSVTSSPTATTVVDQSDLDRMKSAVQLSSPVSSNSLSTLYYSILSQTLLSQTISQSADVCNHLKTIKDQTLESIYYITSTAKLLTNCQLNSAQYMTKLEPVIKEDSSVLDIYRAAISLLNLGKPLDSTKVSKALMSSLKKDESLLNTGLTFQLAAKLSKAEDRNSFVEKIGDIIVQADEVDGRFLQFEGGLGITASIITGVYQLATASNKPVGLTNDQALKFANYFLSRKYVLTPKGISELLEVLKLFTNNKYHIPVVITNYGSSALSPTNSVLTVRVTNVLGASLGPLSVTIDKAVRVDDKNVILSKKPFQGVQGDSKLFAINFLESKPMRGQYDVSVSATPTKADPRLIGNTGVQIKVIVLTQVSIASAEITVADRDTGGSGAVTKLEYPNTVRNPLEADTQQRIVVKFQLRDKIVGDLMTAHQTFVQFVNIKTKQEIVFIAEPDSVLNYKLDLNLLTKAKDLNYVNGVYDILIIIGDAVISNPIQWKIASINLQLSSVTSSSETTETVSPFVPKPEIKHLFREPEKRPALIISNAFSILVLIPIVILFGLWLKIGVNLSNFPFSLSALVFHTGLALIFGLYICFFLKLDMFQTCKYLAGLGVITFLAGHSLLARLAKNRKQ
ncbi:dolichyl-diphosphooligosaccharide--protein glycosyltransferase subunit 2-like [Oppia nitens]|uniref:dolichyl-diphosphooligosaccharide--protein glycosyltransferase subunit 2-like n=1 Tax=Oppia nitens TaxID=1686743 RepID=UPI0023DB204C|nr:dolichyl-diphosphooligosaccharide--protein glycosyltransferase subunit 2-like [Oppia nitens]